MRGAIAAGHEITAQAGARALAEGGNAVDACIAAAFASWVAESPLTGPGAGGFMLVHRGARPLEPAARLLRRRSRPGAGRAPAAARWTPSTFRSRAAAIRPSASSSGMPRAPCPGTVAGLAEAHRAYGTLPWRELLAPAIELARSGVVMTKAQALLHALLDSILRHTPESRAVYGERKRLVAGDRLVADRSRGHARGAGGRRARTRSIAETSRAAIARHVQEHGGDHHAPRPRVRTA